jgi:hypothetical protein
LFPLPAVRILSHPDIFVTDSTAEAAEAVEPRRRMPDMPARAAATAETAVLPQPVRQAGAVKVREHQPAVRSTATFMPAAVAVAAGITALLPVARAVAVRAVRQAARIRVAAAEATVLSVRQASGIIILHYFKYK